MDIVKELKQKTLNSTCPSWANRAMEEIISLRQQLASQPSEPVGKCVATPCNCSNMAKPTCAYFHKPKNSPPSVDVLVKALRLVHEHALLYLPQYHQNQNVHDTVVNALATYSKPITEDK